MPGLLPAGPLVEAGRWVGSYQIDSRSADPPARLSSERTGTAVGVKKYQWSQLGYPEFDSVESIRLRAAAS